MSADTIRLSVQPFGPFAYRPASPAGSAPQAVKIPDVRPAWPDPATIYLAAELLDLSKTSIAYTGTLTLPDTGGDFWALLAAALGEGRRE